MAEEQSCQEGHRLCANNCGFLGSPATMDLCSKCFRDLRLKQQQSTSAKTLISPPQTLIPHSPPSTAPIPDPPISNLPESSRSSDAPRRCTDCRKRVGLTGFRCRCGFTFCGSHRYPEKHSCSFDFKSAGREKIAMENPVVKGEKLQKI